VRHQPDSAPVGWFHHPTQDGRSTTKKTMIVALPRKLLISLRELIATGQLPEAFVCTRPSERRGGEKATVRRVPLAGPESPDDPR
jgi:hypothetical protein